ncbi:MAG: GDP-mannose 4,6-dehydratase, partial [Bacilli bacterium]|nr:GDP-mannose 4,6-dehydratase [Bacilli bacterium]
MNKQRIELKGKTVLVTGSAGFIGFFLSKRLLDEFDDITVVGLDNVNDYYDVDLKDYRLNILQQYDHFQFIKGNLADKKLVNQLF